MKSSSKSNNEEIFDPGWILLSDEELCKLPETIFTPLTMFVYTFDAKFTNMKVSVVDALEILTPLVVGSSILAIRSNFGQICQPGYEKYLKAPKIRMTEEEAAKAGLPIRRQRKLQGTGTCFNSALEPVIRIEDPVVQEMRPLKGNIYFAKCFPTTGLTQVPGGIRENLADAKNVVRVLAKYFCEQGLANDIEIVEENVKLMNFKFRLVRRSARILICIQGLLDFFKAEIYPEYTPFDKAIREAKQNQRDTKMSFKFVVGIDESNSKKRGKPKHTRINIFQSGKINILGGKSKKEAELIYSFLVRLFQDNWKTFVSLKPRRDSELKKMEQLRASRRAASNIPEQSKEKDVHPTSTLEGSEKFRSGVCLDTQSFSGSLLEFSPTPVIPITLEAMADSLSQFGSLTLDDSKDFLLDEVKRDDIEDNKKNSLKNRTVSGRGASTDGSAKLRDNIVSENIAHDEDKY